MQQRIRLAVLVSLVALTVVGCFGRKPEKAPSRGLSQIAATGQIRIGMSGEQPPLTMTAKNGALLGLDVALSKVLAKSMGVEPVFVRMPFRELLAAVESGDIDMAMSGITITPERSRRVTFVGPYYTSGKSILTKSPELAAVTVPQDLDSPDLRLAALAGSTSEIFVKGSMPRAKLVAEKSLDDAIQDVVAGRVDALVADRETNSFAVLRNPGAGLIASQESFTVEPMGIAVASDDPRLANLVQTYLNALDERGVLERARRFWFQDPSWVKDLR